MKNIVITAICVGALSLTGSAIASEKPELVVSGSSASGNTQVALDILSKGQVTALDFEIRVPEQFQSMNTNNCVQALPSTHIGSCSLSNGILKVIVYSPTNAILSDGEIGLVQLPGVLSDGQVEIANVHMFSADGAAVQHDALTDFGAVDTGRPGPHDFKNRIK